MRDAAFGARNALVKGLDMPVGVVEDLSGAEDLLTALVGPEKAALGRAMEPVT